MTSACLSAEQIQAFLACELECAEERTLSEHINQCDDCDRKMAELSNDLGARKLGLASFRRNLEPETSGAVKAVSRRMQALAIYECAASAEPEAQASSRDSAAATSQVPPLTRLGRYQIERLLGAGTFGIVYLAEDQRLHRKVALKVARTSALSDGELRVRFFREAETLARLAHPHILPVYEADEIDGLCFLAVAFCDGPTLEDWLSERSAPLDARWAAGLLAPLADAVEHAHLQGVLHRDIKPGNVLLHKAPAGAVLPVVPQLTDFGLAKLMEDDSHASVSGVVLGTPQYMAPEQAAGDSDGIVPATDVYALGAVLYRMLTGRPPIESNSTIDTLRRVLMEQPQDVRSRVSSVPADLNAIVMKCLEKSAADRYSTASELADDLRRFLHGRPTKARPLSRSRRAARWVRRNPALTALLTLAAAVVGLSLGLWDYSQRLSQTQSAAAHESHKSLVLTKQIQSNALSSAQRDYVNDIRVAAAEAFRGNTSKAVTALARQIPKPDEPDLRGFGWHCLWSLVHRKPLAETDAGEDVYQIRLSPDDRELVAAGKDGTLRFYDAARLTLMEAVPTGQGELNGVAYSPDGQRVATAGDNGTVCIWDAATHRHERTIAAHSGYAFDVLFFDGGNKIASCGKDSAIRLWDVASGEALGELTGHTNAVEALALSPDGKLLASAASDQSALIWSLSERKAIHTLKGFNHRLTCICFSPDGRWLATGSLDRTATLWDVQSGRRLAQQMHLDGVQALAFSRDGKRLKVADCSGTIRNYSIVLSRSANPTVKLMLRSLDDAWSAHTTRLWSVAAGSTVKLLYSADKDGVLRCWRPERNQQVQRSIPVPRRDLYVDLEFSADAQSIFVLRESSGVVVLDAATLRPRRVLHARQTQWRALGVLAERGQIAAGNAQGVVTIWDLNTGEQMLMLESLPRAGAVMDLAYSQHMGQLAVLSQNADGVCLYDSISGEFAGLLPAKFPSAMAMSPDGQRLAVGSGGDVIVYDLVARKPLNVLRGHSGTLHALAFSSDGALIASSGSDRTVRFWSQDGEFLSAMAEHSATVTRLQFTPDGLTLVSGDDAGVLKLSHVGTGRAMFDLPTNTDRLRGLAVAPGSRQIAVIRASSDILLNGAPPTE